MPNPYETETVPAVLSALKVQASSGLALAEIPVRQATYGLNEVPERQPSMLLLLVKHFWGLTAFMLEVTILISFLLHKYIDAYLISGLMGFNAVVGFLQERKAAKTVQALKSSLQVMVRVLREGRWAEVAGNQLVPGDIIRIRTGDFITADAKLIDGATTADQSALTGESARIDKKEGNILYAGSAVKSGECTAVVVATGINTFFGKTAELVQQAKPRLHMEEVVSGVVKVLFAIVLAFVAVTLVVSLLRGEAFLAMLPLLLILLISAVPVALPSMFSVSMARGSRQLAAQGVLVSRLSATEDAATLTTLCIDKTGTLTQNKLTVQEIISADHFAPAEVTQYAVMASVAANNDPIDMAFIRKAEEEKTILSSFKQLSFTPFTPALKRTEALIEKDGKSFKVLKGAYPTIKALCRQQPAGFNQTVETWGTKGFKTIAVALQQDNVTQWVGLAALMDPPFPGTADMIAQIKKSGVSIKMLTGDALPIAKEIAGQVGIGSAIAAADLFRKEADTKKKLQVILSHDGFAEVLPEDKFNIVKALQTHREVTGMTGDGVNDAPALKQAEVGIAVKTATDVAKQAAGVILLRDGLQSILHLISIGREIHHRITSWVTNKISKTLFTVLFVCTAYLVTGQFVVDTFDMVLLLLIVDFVTLPLSTDTVTGSNKPGNWAMKPLMKLGFLLGLLNTAEGLCWIFLCRHYFHISTIDEIHSLSFAILFYSGIINILVIRTPARFYQKPIGKILLFSIIGDALFVLTLLAVGLPGFAPLPPISIGATLIYLLVCGLLVNDWLKFKIAPPASSPLT
ncbi:MAG: plasma-membrane proton-efflux P-type ATPase [Puia sp.]|nr:plasma-membrane proton-efflux P-type ATPase [Puia sp.]